MVPYRLRVSVPCLVPIALVLFEAAVAAVAVLLRRRIESGAIDYDHFSVRSNSRECSIHGLSIWR